MTLIANLVSKHYVLQVADRLITRNASPFDQFSNKNIIYIAPNGIVAIAYTGHAYIDEVTTDQWLVEKIIGQSFDRNKNLGTLRIGRNPNWLHIGRTILLLKKEIDNAHENIRKSLKDDWLKSLFEITIAGWQWNKRGRVRPIIETIEKTYNSNSSIIRRAHRAIFFKKYFLYMAPTSNISKQQRKSLNKQIAESANADIAEKLIVDTIREISKSNPLIGPNCLSIFIPPPQTHYVRVRYLATEDLITTMTTATSEHELLTTFSPWVVGKSGVHAPSIIGNDGTSVNIGGFTVKIEGFPTPGPAGFVKSQERPKQP